MVKFLPLSLSLSVFMYVTTNAHSVISSVRFLYSGVLSLEWKIVKNKRLHVWVVFSCINKSWWVDWGKEERKDLRSLLLKAKRVTSSTNATFDTPVPLLVTDDNAFPAFSWMFQQKKPFREKEKVKSPILSSESIGALGLFLQHHTQKI